MEEQNTPPSENRDEQLAGQEESTGTYGEGEVDHQKNETVDTDTANEIDFKLFFKLADSTVYFIGDGNEFVSYTEKTTWLAANYVATIVDNGGAVL